MQKVIETTATFAKTDIQDLIKKGWSVVGLTSCGYNNETVIVVVEKQEK